MPMSVCQGDGALAALPGDTDGKAPPEVRQAIDTLGANVTNGKPRQVRSRHPPALQAAHGMMGARSQVS